MLRFAFIIVLWQLLDAVAGSIQRRSKTSRFKLDIDGKDFCLALRSRECVSNSSVAGTCALAVQCHLIQQQARLIGDDIRDLWRLDSNGLLISHASGLCLTAASEGLHSQCTVHDRWRLISGKLESLLHPTRCISPKLRFPSDDADAYDLELVDCKHAVPLRMEHSRLVVYPIPESSWKGYGSPKYAVTVKETEGFWSHTCFVYYTEPSFGDPLYGQSASYLTFSFEGSVIVSVTKLGGSFNQVQVRPLSLNIQAQKQGSSVAWFEVTQPGSKISVEFDDDWTRDSLLIFADPIENDIPPMFDSSVTYYNVGEHYTNVNVQAGTEIYVAGGAFLFPKNVVEPTFHTQSLPKDNIYIHGRGVVSGKTSFLGVYPITLCGSNHQVEGISVIDAPQQSHLQINAPWACNAGWSGSAGGARIDNVKLLGWKYADGIYAGRRSHVSNVFVKVNDDGVKPFESDSLFENLVIWQQQNGWAIMLSWLTEEPQSNITVRDATIIHDGHKQDYPVAGCNPCYPNQATIGAVHGGSSKITDVVVDGVVMETEVWRPVWFGIDKSKWGHAGTGVLEGWTLKNVQILGGAKKDSQILGTAKSSQVTNMRFVEFEFMGCTATSLTSAHIDVTGSTKHVSVSASTSTPLLMV